jgi:hypothetical protein
VEANPGAASGHSALLPPAPGSLPTNWAYRRMAADIGISGAIRTRRNGAQTPIVRETARQMGTIEARLAACHPGRPYAHQLGKPRRVAPRPRLLGW